MGLKMYSKKDVMVKRVVLKSWRGQSIRYYMTPITLSECIKSLDNEGYEVIDYKDLTALAVSVVK